MIRQELFAQSIQATNRSVIWTALRAAALLCAASLLATAASAQTRTVPAQSSKPVISLINEMPKAASATTLVKGEASFANAPANFHAFASAQVGHPAYPDRLTLHFAASTTLTQIKSSKEFQVVDGSTCIEQGYYAAGESCDLLVQFDPQGPGRRLGNVTITNTASATPFSLGLGGFGFAPVVSFTPAVISTVPGTFPSSKGLLTSAKNLADAGDILYIADTGNSLIRKIDSSGTITNVTPVAAPASITVDNFGLIYSLAVPGSTDFFSFYEPDGGFTFYFGPYAPGACTVSAPCVLSTIGMDQPAEINIDPNNNLFLEEGTEGAMEAPVAGLAGHGGLAPIDAWYLNDVFAYTSTPASTFAVDANDNLYTSDLEGTTVCFLLQEPLFEAEGSNPNYTRVAGGANCGFSGDGGQATNAEIGSSVGQMAFDLAGDMYFSDTANQRVREISAATGIINTIAGNGTAGYTGDGGAATSATLSSPAGVAVDSQGQVYIISGAAATGTAQVIRKLGPNGLLSFGSQQKASASAAHLVTVSNTGNSTLTLTNTVITGANASDFSIDPTTTSCILTAGATLFAGQSCKVGIIFKPTAAGSFVASLVMLDNTVTNSNTVQLSGIGTLPAPTLKITSPANGASFTSGTAVTFSVSVTGSGVQPTGTVQFKVDGSNHGTPVTLSSTGTASTSVTGLTVTTHTLSATYSGDSNYLPVGPVSITITVTAATAVKFTAPSTTQSHMATTPVPLAVTVTAKTAMLPTGKVNFSVDGKSVITTALVSGKASANAGTLAVGVHTLKAAYSGDKYHLPSQTSEKITVSTP